MSSAIFSSEVLTRENGRRWPSSVYASHSWILSRMSFNCIGSCTIDPFVSRSQSCGSKRVTFQQAFNSPPTCFSVSLLPLLTSSQIPAPRTTFTETPLFEICSAKIGPRNCVFHQQFSMECEAPSPRASPFRLEYRMQCHCLPETMGRLEFRVFDPRPIFPTPREFS